MIRRSHLDQDQSFLEFQIFIEILGTEQSMFKITNFHELGTSWVWSNILHEPYSVVVSSDFYHNSPHSNSRHRAQCGALIMAFMAINMKINPPCRPLQKIWALFQYPIRRIILRSRKVSCRVIDIKNGPIALKFGRYIGSTAAEAFVKFQSDVII